MNWHVLRGMKFALIFPMYRVLALLLVFPSIVLADTAKIGHLVPEFTPSKGVVVSSGYQLKLKTFVDQHNSNSYAKANAYAAINERFSAYQKLASSLPDQKVYIFTDPTPYQGSSEKEFLEKNMNLTANTELIWPTGGASKIDEWTRDFVGFTVEDINDGSYSFVDMSQDERGKEANLFLSSSPTINIPLKKLGGDWQGGDLMTSGNGVCFYSEDGNGYTPDLEKICSKIIGVPELPIEETGHIDMFAKFLSPTHLVLAQYQSNNFHIATNTFEVDLECSDQQIQDQEWYSCLPKEGRMKTNLGLETSSSKQIEYNHNQLKQYISTNFPDSTISDDGKFLLEKIKQADFLQHYSNTHNVFSKMGYTVIPLKTPQPYVSFSIQNYQDKNGNTVHKVLGLKTRFRSYANSLIMNNKAFIPTYSKTTPDNTLLNGAMSVYASHGFKPITIPMDHTLETWGAIHCLTMQIPQ